MRPTFPYDGTNPGHESIELIAATGDVGALVSALQFRQGESIARHSAHMVAECADRPRYAVAEVWDHYFSDDVPEFDTRWVFDRRRWCVAVLHVKRRSSFSWSFGLPDEVADLEESLVDANAAALVLEMDEWGVGEADELPGWVTEATMVDRRTFVEAMP